MDFAKDWLIAYAGIEIDAHWPKTILGIKTFAKGIKYIKNNILVEETWQAFKSASSIEELTFLWMSTYSNGLWDANKDTDGFGKVLSPEEYSIIAKRCKEMPFFILPVQLKPDSWKFYITLLSFENDYSLTMNVYDLEEFKKKLTNSKIVLKCSYFVDLLPIGVPMHCAFPLKSDISTFTIKKILDIIMNDILLDDKVFTKVLKASKGGASEYLDCVAEIGKNNGIIA